MGAGTAVIQNDKYKTMYVMWMYENHLKHLYESGQRITRMLEDLIAANPQIWEDFPLWADILQQQRGYEEPAQHVIPMLRKMHVAYNNISRLEDDGEQQN